MQFHWPKLRAAIGGLLPANSAQAQRKYDLQPAAEFLFETSPFSAECADRTPGQPAQPGLRFAAANQLPYQRTRLESVTLSRSEVPALTIAADASESVAVSGHRRDDWSLRYCADGVGSTEVEARERLQDVSLIRAGATVSLNGPGLGRTGARGNLIVEAPADAPITVHTSFAPVEVRDMTGPVRVTAIHARAKLLNPTGNVAASAFVVDFAGAKGSIVLSAEAEINLKFTSIRFQGALTAWAQRCVRVLVPSAFQTPFQALVNRPEDFICRAEFSSAVKQEKKGGLYVFTHMGDGSVPADRVHLRSEHATVVIDTAR